LYLKNAITALRLYRKTKQFKETNDLKQRSRSDCPKCLTPIQRHYLNRIAKSQKYLSILEYKVCVLRLVPFLTSEAMNHYVA
ncbi:17915_t:CDS:2, partial [Funneliformis geosporum]